MTGRRSARIQNRGRQEPESVEVKQRATEDVATMKMKKTTDPVLDTTEGLHRQIQRVGNSELSSAQDTLRSLPPEIMNMILGLIKDTATISKLGRTSKRYHALVMPDLYRHVMVGAAFYGNIPKFIRAIEPHLTIAQKKQLKKEAKYKGQQKRYSTKLDEDFLPPYANHVRHMVVCRSDPGRKHQCHLNRYLEEAFKNMTCLETVETQLLTNSMALSLASQKNLRALFLWPKDFEAGAMQPLAKLGNLIHLGVESRGASVSASDVKAIRSMLMNSKSTLKSLVIKGVLLQYHIWKDLEKKTPADSPFQSQSHDLTALKSFALFGSQFDEGFIKSLHNAIDFAGLRYLALGHLADGNRLLFQHLASLTPSSPNSTPGMSLQGLFLEMPPFHSYPVQSLDEKQAEIEARFRFISSFDTLTSLILDKYTRDPRESIPNSGLPDNVLQAILKHKKLGILKVHSEFGNTAKVQFFSVGDVASIIGNLPHLQEFAFAPYEKDLHEVGKALSKAPNLTSVACSPCNRRMPYPPTDPHGLYVLKEILAGFLSCEAGSKSNVFIWEEYTKLRHLSNGNLRWGLASKFGESVKGVNVITGVEEVEKTSNGDGEREVFCRFETNFNKVDISSSFLSPSEWVERITTEFG